MTRVKEHPKFKRVQAALERKLKNVSVSGKAASFEDLLNSFSVFKNERVE